MNLLYLTADEVGIQSGGGLVTAKELQAIQTLGETQVISRKELVESRDAWEWTEERFPNLKDPWGWDKLAYFLFGSKVKLAHVYAGTFSESVQKLRSNGAKVTYTAAAHDIQVSKREHEKLGIPFGYTHLTDPALWARYVKGYLEADVVICPSSLSRDCQLSYGCKDVRIIPHGVHVPNECVSPPERFTVGYLGAIGPDKGLIYLLAAWRTLEYKDATLVIAGGQSRHEFVLSMIHALFKVTEIHPDTGEIKTDEGCSIRLMGWVDQVSDFYNGISLYVQPSTTEGFGCEVLEAMAHGRPVVCSRGAGAADVLSDGYLVDACNVDQLADQIEVARAVCKNAPIESLKRWQDHARKYTWDKIQQQYIDLWRGLL